MKDLPCCALSATYAHRIWNVVQSNVSGMQVIHGRSLGFGLMLFRDDHAPMRNASSEDAKPWSLTIDSPKEAVVMA